MKPPKGVPRDEWLLAKMLAAGAISALGGSFLDPGTDRSAAYNGFYRCSSDDGNRGAYAAGAALAMALEGP